MRCLSRCAGMGRRRHCWWARRSPPTATSTCSRPRCHPSRGPRRCRRVGTATTADAGGRAARIRLCRRTPVRESRGSGRLVAEPGGQLDSQTRFSRAAQSNQYGQPLLRGRPRAGQHASAEVGQICGPTHEPGEIGRQSRRPEELLGRHRAHDCRLEKGLGSTTVGSFSAWTDDSRCGRRLSNRSALLLAPLPARAPSSAPVALRPVREARRRR
jgi:hypothetical protein